MKRISVLCAALLLGTPCGVLGVDVGIHGTTMVRIEERSHGGFSDDRIVPAYQYLGLDAQNLADGNLSLHLYGWGRYDLADRSAGDKDGDGEFTYGYLRYLFPRGNGEIRAGRSFVNAGVVNEHLDGVVARADLLHGFTATLLGGAPVQFDHDNKGDYIVGGRVAFRRPGWLEIGASAVHEEGAISRKLVGGVSPASTAEDERQVVGGDIWLSLGKSATLNGLTSYNTTVSAIAEHNYALTINPVKPVSVTALFIERDHEGYFAGTNVPRIFIPTSAADSKQYGGNLTYSLPESIELSLDYRRIDRSDLGNSDWYGAEARLGWAALSSRAGVSYHRYDAPDVSTVAVILPNYSLSFHQVRGWLFQDFKSFFITLDAIGNFYDDDANPQLNGESSDYDAVFSASYRALPGLTVSADIGYGANALHKEELRALVRAEFGFSTAHKGGSK